LNVSHFERCALALAEGLADQPNFARPPRRSWVVKGPRDPIAVTLPTIAAESREVPELPSPAAPSTGRAPRRTMRKLRKMFGDFSPRGASGGNVLPLYWFWKTAAGGWTAISAALPEKPMQYYSFKEAEADAAIE
jgi:hypothetical protein